jgi:type 1 glutamine amidotransferase
MKLQFATTSHWIMLIMLIALATTFSCTDGLLADEPIAVEKPKMLMVTQSAGYRHGPVKREGDQLISPAEKAMKQIAARTGLFDVDFTQDVATHLTRENLQKYDLVAFYTSGDLPIAPADLKYLLEEWVRQPGHGFLGFHSASDTYKNHEPYWDFIGGTFAGHPWGANTKVTITVHDTAHPAMKPFGDEIELKEEIYQYTNWQPEKVRVLMSLDMAKTDKKMPYHVPVAWVKQVGQGRMYYNNLGHRNDTWENEQFLKSIEGAVRWIQGTEKGEATPNPEVSQEQHKLSIAAAKAAGITVNSIEAEKRAKQARQAENQARKKAAAEKKKAEEEKKRDKSDK